MMDGDLKGVPRKSETSLTYVVSNCALASLFLRHQQIRVGRDRRTGNGFADADVQLL